MAIYAIGDIQGCYDELRALLTRLDFRSGRDCLWLVGDLVNRGPKSLETLRYVADLGDAAVCVLGNHDLHLLAANAGARQPCPNDTLQSVLDAPDREELIEWLRRRPLLHHDRALGCTMLHAGLPPQWDLATARARSQEVEGLLRGPDYCRFLFNMYGDEPDCWSDDLEGWDRARVIINCFARLRYCDSRGRMDMKANGPPGTQAAGLMPWFQVPGRRSADLNVVFGHWSALGYHRAPGVIALDTGCVWGGTLTAVRLDAAEPSPMSVACDPRGNAY